VEPLIDLGDGASLRPVQAGDADELDALVEANREYLARWMPWAPAQTRESTRDFIDTAIAQQAAENGFQAVLVVDGAIAGVFGYHGIDRVHHRTTLGYWLAEAAQGRGLATRAVAALIDHAFGEWGLHRVEIRAAVDNAPSRAVCERAGLTFEGELREAERVGGRYHDLAVYSVLDAEWPQAQS
jgi:ribosomal-protein-serine acetyltransferase